MRITVEVHAITCGLFPSGEGALDLSPDTPLTDVLNRLDLKTDPDEVFPALINGTPVPPNERKQTLLKNGDHLVVFPPIEGG